MAMTASTYCTSCATTRREKGLEPQEFIVLDAVTEKKKLHVYWCQTCDGERKDA